MSMDEDEETLCLCLSEQTLEQIDSWRKAQRPPIEDRSTAIANLIDISRPPSYRNAEKVWVAIVGPMVKKVWGYTGDPEDAAEALLMLGLQQERERECERIIASYEGPVMPEIEFEEDEEPLDLELEDCIDEGPFET
jgi:hypothetical protein